MQPLHWWRLSTGLAEHVARTQSLLTAVLNMYQGVSTRKDMNVDLGAPLGSSVLQRVYAVA